MEAGDASRGRDLLDGLHADSVASYQAYWVCRARVLRVLGDDEGSRTALSRAVGLTSNPAVRAYLLEDRH